MILPSPLYVVCDAEACARQGWALVDFAAACMDAGARLLQIRAKQLSGSAFLGAAREIIVRASRFNATIVINDRADIAALAGAPGIHVGQDDLTPEQVRRVAADKVFVGLSTHTPDQIQDAVRQQIDYLAVGPVFGTMTKETGYDAVGLARVKEASTEAARRRLPVVAIGGITLQNALSVIDAGAASVAVISDLFVGGNPSARVQRFLQTLSGHGDRRAE